jgi:hypothetical protein
MKRYSPSIPRLALGLLAVAAAAINFGALVVFPAEMDLADAEAQTLAAREAELPHTDSGRVALADGDSRQRRHETFERLVANVQSAGLMRLAGPFTTRSDR